MRFPISYPLRSVASGEEVPPQRPHSRGPAEHVLVSYESSARGRAALWHALMLAREARAPLTVVSVASKEVVTVGCARCRHSAAIWNREMRLLADEELGEAAGLVGADPGVDYEVAVGHPAHALAEAAVRGGADVIVLPWEPTGRIRRRFSSSVARDLREPGRWKVIVAPAATPPSGEGSRVAPRGGAMGTSVSAINGRDVDSERQRLRHGIACSLVCLAVSVSLFAMGRYH